MIAPVTGSGSTPAWIAFVPKERPFKASSRMLASFVSSFGGPYRAAAAPESTESPNDPATAA